MGNRLCNFSRSDGDYRYRLQFFNEDSGKHWSVQANAIILAMPQRSIELLDQENFFFDQDRRPDLQRGIDSVIRQPSFKLLMGFEKPWWEEHLGAHAGESITDLPLRQCYYFGVDPENGHSLFLASYNDMRTVPFWNVLAGADGATEVMVNEALNQVAELHGLDRAEIGQPYVAFYKDWSADPYGGGYHAWHAGVDVQRTMPFMRCPDPGEAVHICGEAWSDQQGWVEGAFCVAENMLQDWFGLEWPTEWLSEDYYLGW
jgi:monoamine oxidase